jgi:hypothetical protein
VEENVFLCKSSEKNWLIGHLICGKLENLMKIFNDFWLFSFYSYPFFRETGTYLVGFASVKVDLPGLGKTVFPFRVILEHFPSPKCMQMKIIQIKISTIERSKNLFLSKGHLKD